MPATEDRAREKLARWHLGLAAGQLRPADRPDVLTDNWMGRTVAHNFQRLARLVPPRTVAAVWSTIWNRWHTHRRHQGRDEEDDHCVFTCSCNAADSVEHYRYCPVVRRAGFNHLDLREAELTSRAFFLVEPELQSDEALTKVAILIYGVYRAVHTCRFTRPATPTEGYDLMCSLLQQAVQGDRRASQLLDGARCTGRRAATSHAPPP